MNNQDLYKNIKEKFNSLNSHKKNVLIQSIFNYHIFDQYSFAQNHISFTNTQGAFNLSLIWETISYQLIMFKKNFPNKRLETLHDYEPISPLELITIDKETETKLLDINKTISTITNQYNQKYCNHLDEYIYKNKSLFSHFINCIFFNNDDFVKFIKAFPKTTFDNQKTIAANAIYNQQFDKITLLLQNSQFNPLTAVSVFQHSALFFFKEFFYANHKTKLDPKTNLTTIIFNPPDYSDFLKHTKNSFKDIFKNNEYLIDHLRENADPIEKYIATVSNGLAMNDIKAKFNHFLNEVVSSLKKDLLEDHIISDIPKKTSQPLKNVKI